MIPSVGGRSQVCDLGIPTVSDPCVYDPPAIVDTDVVGQHLRELIPVAGCEVRHVALDSVAGRVVQPRCRQVELIEPCECSVEVCLVEQFATAEQIAVEHENPDALPLGLESLLRGATRSVGDNHSKVAQAMDSLDIAIEVRCVFK